jgi:hypothetical protein
MQGCVRMNEGVQEGRSERVCLGLKNSNNAEINAHAPTSCACFGRSVVSTSYSTPDSISMGCTTLSKFYTRERQR